MKKTNRVPFLLAIATALFVPAISHANVGIEIEPIVGYERTQKLVPSAHTTDRLIYGARANIGLALISIESEYTRGTDTESFPSDDLTVKDTDDKLKLGLRSSLGLGTLIRLIARGGVQAKQNRHEETTAGETTTTLNPIVYKPYAGAGLRAAISNKIALTAGITAVFNDFPDMSQNEYQTTAGFTVKFP